MRKDKKSAKAISIPLDDLLGYQLRRASAAMLAQLIAGYNELDIKLAEASALILIEANPGLKQSDIGRILDIKSANMAPLVSFLEKQNYVERKQLDGRSQALYLSKQGKTIARKIGQCNDENEKWLLSKLSEGDKRVAIKLLKSIWH
jgi:DNA-binding MarR family transcriptional regulator